MPAPFRPPPHPPAKLRMSPPSRSPGETVMSIATATSLRVAPSEVHGTLKQHMLADGFGVVLDLERSHGSWLYDSLRERELLDFFTNFSSYPMGYNHPKLLTP